MDLNAKQMEVDSFGEQLLIIADVMEDKRVADVLKNRKEKGTMPTLIRAAGLICRNHNADVVRFLALHEGVTVNELDITHKNVMTKLIEVIQTPEYRQAFSLLAKTEDV